MGAGVGGCWFDFCPQSKVAPAAQTKSIALPIHTRMQDAGLPQTTEVSEKNPFLREMNKAGQQHLQRRQ